MTPTEPTVQMALVRGGQRLQAGGIEDGRRDARALMAAALDIPPDRLIGRGPEPLPPEAAARFEAFLARRLAHEPVSRIRGSRLFWGRSFRITPAVLDPRPETERLVELALEAPFSTVLDLGTGSGCILCTLLAERPAAQGVGTDVSTGALDVAAGNAAALGVADRCRLLAGDWYAPLDGGAQRFDLIVSNPPYIAAIEMADLAPDVGRYDPGIALTDGGDGLGAYRAILAGLGRHLAPGGRLLAEIGWRQGAAVAGLFRAAGLDAVAVHADLEGRDRVVSARLDPVG